MATENNSRGLKLRKLFHSIGEVAEQTGIPAHVLRYWEGEFAELSPKKGRNGSRLYQDRDIEIVRQIKELLYEKKFTIQGARTQLRQRKNGASPEEERPLLDEIRGELRDILKLIDK